MAVSVSSQGTGGPGAQCSTPGGEGVLIFRDFLTGTHFLSSPALAVEVGSALPCPIRQDFPGK